MTRSALLVTVVVLAQACSGGDDEPACATSADCPSGLCVDGTCRERPDGGGECAGDGECDDGNACNGAETCAAGACTPGGAAPNGTPCDADADAATPDFCAAGLCAPSRCGDGVVDAMAMEECDDANAVDADGCDDCRFSCSADADCGDAEECNGEESCDTTSHVCRAGTPAGDGTACLEGTGECMDAACVPRSCTMDEECRDASPCNGTEACVSGSCVRGTPLDCDDGIPCTEDECSPRVAGGCMHRLVDADFDGHAPSTLGACGDDCDDGDPTVYAGAPDGCDGVDNDCDMMTDEDESVTFFADCDGDGYAAMGGASITACAVPSPALTGCPTGGTWTGRRPADASSSDCNDANATVRPSQTLYQTTPIAGAPAERDFDYDCDGTETPGMSTSAATCVRVFTTACRMTAPGWVGPVPACGMDGVWATTCVYSGGACTARGTTRPMACR